MLKNQAKRKLDELQKLTADPSDEFIMALSSIDSVQIVNNDSVRSALEDKKLKTLNELIDSFSSLTGIITNLFENIDQLDKSCDSMLSKLSIGQKGVDEVLDMTNSLHSQQEKQKHQLTKIHNFIEEYYLSDEDIDTLKNGDMNDAFFEAFSHLEKSQSNVSLASQTSSAKCLSDASAKLHSLKEEAFQRAYYWINNNVHLFDRSNPTIPAVFNRCLDIARQKPLLYSFNCEQIAKVRGGVVGRAFMRALSTGDGENEPLEASSATDPLRFASDVFAWLHQTAATESGFISQVLREDKDSAAVSKAVGVAFESVCRPVDARVGQAVRSLLRPADLYQIANVCAFYESTFGEICGVTSALPKTIASLKSQAVDTFKDGIGQSVKEIRQQSRPSMGSINEALRAVSEISQLHRQSALSVAFDVGSLIESYAVELKTAIVGSRDGPIFQLCALFELLRICRDGRLDCTEEVSAEFEQREGAIIAAESEDVIRRCRVAEVIATVRSEETRPLSNVAGMEQQFIRNAIGRFETGLIGSPIHLPLVDSITLPELQKEVRDGVVALLVGAFEELFNAVMDPKNGYVNPGSMFRYMPNMVKDMIMT